MFQEQIQKVKKKRKLMCMIGIPFCLLFVGTGWGITRMFDEKDFPFWIVQILFVVLGLCVAGYIIKLYLEVGRRAAAMKAAVDSASDEDMSALMAESAVFLSEYYISAMYVLNFETLTAYPRSQIQKLESYKVSHTDSDGSYKGTDYCIRIWYGNGKKDRMVFAKTGTRDEVYEILKDGLQA